MLSFIELVIFQGGVRTPYPHPSGCAHAHLCILAILALGKQLDTRLRCQLLMQVLLFLSVLQNFTPVIILTYMRSGSSLTGEIMQQHPDAFYVFEPLRMLTITFRDKLPLQFLNGTSM